MGKIIIEVPSDGTIDYLIQDADTAKSLIEKLDKIALHVKGESKKKTPTIVPPTVSREEGLKAGFGLWADREETGEEIAMRIRKANRRE